VSMGVSGVGILFFPSHLMPRAPSEKPWTFCKHATTMSLKLFAKIESWLALPCSSINEWKSTRVGNVRAQSRCTQNLHFLDVKAQTRNVFRQYRGSLPPSKRKLKELRWFFPLLEADNAKVVNYW